MKAFLIRSLHTSVAHWAVCLLISFSYLKLFYSINFPIGSAPWVMLTVMFLPAIMTFILVPRSIRKWYRWFVLIFLSMTVEPPALMPLVLGVGTAWALYRSWFAERPLPLKKMFSLRKDPKASTKPTTVAEVLAAEKSAEERAAAKVRVASKKQKAAAAQAARKDQAAATQAAKSATVKEAEQPN